MAPLAARNRAIATIFITFPTQRMHAHITNLAYMFVACHTHDVICQNTQKYKRGDKCGGYENVNNIKI